MERDLNKGDEYADASYRAWTLTPSNTSGQLVILSPFRIG